MLIKFICSDSGIELILKSSTIETESLESVVDCAIQRMLQLD